MKEFNFKHKSTGSIVSVRAVNREAALTKLSNEVLNPVEWEDFNVALTQKLKSFNL